MVDYAEAAETYEKFLPRCCAGHIPTGRIPLIEVNRHPGAFADRAYANVTVIDVPTSRGIVATAADKSEHAFFRPIGAEVKPLGIGGAVSSDLLRARVRVSFHAERAARTVAPHA